MSYCRWSSDNSKSDVYVYQDVNGGWTTHVAANRRLGLETLPPDPLIELYSPEPNFDHKAWNVKYKTHRDALSALEFEEIKLPHAGESFNDPTPQDCAATLKMLRETGYHVPDGVIEALESEQPEE